MSVEARTFTLTWSGQWVARAYNEPALADGQVRTIELEPVLDLLEDLRELAEETAVKQPDVKPWKPIKDAEALLRTHGRLE